MVSTTVIDKIREIASNSKHTFRELSFDETLQFILFRGGVGNRCTLYIYYSPSSDLNGECEYEEQVQMHIGGCFDDSRKGKVQLLVRNASIVEVESAFNAPARFVQAGFYRKSISNEWKKAKESGNENPATFETDSARRWRYVAGVTGLVNDEREVEELVSFCTKIDGLYWDQDYKSPFLTRTRFDCGSRAAMNNMILRSVKRLLQRPVFGCRWSDVDEYMNRKNQIADVEKTEEDCSSPNLDLSEETFAGVDRMEEDHSSPNLDLFEQAFGDDLAALEKKLESFAENVQIELLRWLFSRVYGAHIIVDESLNKLETNRSAMVDIVHAHYGQLNYPKKHKMCLKHGVVDDFVTKLIKIISHSTISDDSLSDDSLDC